MPIVISICSAPKPEEKIWRDKLGTMSTLININKTIPKIVDESKVLTTRESILLITGGHGDAKKGFINGASLEKWDLWIAIHKKKIKFNIIIIDCCDSICLVPSMYLLIKKGGIIVSNISTGHGLRAHLLESRFLSLSAIYSAIKKNIIATVDLLQGSNLSLTSHRFCFFPQCVKPRLKVDHDKRHPINLDKTNEEELRKWLLKNIQETALAKEVSIKLNPLDDLSASLNINNRVCYF